MKRGKLISFVFAAAMLVTCCFGTNTADVYAAGGEGSITAGSVSGKPGETVTIPVTVTENPGLVSMYISVNYDEGLTLTKVEDTKLFTDAVHGKDLTENPYKMNWDMSLSDANITDTGIIANLTFKIDEDAVGGDYKVWITYEAGNIIDYDLNDVVFNCIEGKVTVITQENCNHKYTDYTSDNNATCTKNGTKTAECDNGCGAKNTIEDTGSKLSHKLGDWKVTKKATTTSTGEKVRECSSCDYTETKVIPVITEEEQKPDADENQKPDTEEDKNPDAGVNSNIPTLISIMCLAATGITVTKFLAKKN